MAARRPRGSIFAKKNCRRFTQTVRAGGVRPNTQVTHTQRRTKTEDSTPATNSQRFVSLPRNLPAFASCPFCLSLPIVQSYCGRGAAAPKRCPPRPVGDRYPNSEETRDEA